MSTLGKRWAKQAECHPELPAYANKQCLPCYNRVRYLAGRERLLEKSRWRHIKRKYGLTKDQYMALLEAQGGVCAICHQPDPRGIQLSVDHDHKTLRVRGLLCLPCNRHVGYFEKLGVDIVAYLKGGK